MQLPGIGQPIDYAAMAKGQGLWSPDTLAQGLQLARGQGATLGNPQAVAQAQAQQQQNLAEMMARYQAEQGRGQFGDALMGTQYVQNSGALGALAQALSMGIGGRVKRLADEKASDYAGRVFAEQQRMEQEQAAAQAKAAAEERAALQAREDKRDETRAQREERLAQMRIDAADRRAAQSAEARVAAARISASGQGQGGGRILTGDEAKAAGLDPGGRYWIDGRTGKPTVVQAPQSADPVQARADREVGAAQAGLANEALNFAADFTGRSVDELRALSPDQLEKVITEGGRFMTGPVFGRVLGADSLFNSDLVASTESAAARQARINNPTGPIANADMDAARRQVWAPERPAEVNARLIRRAVESARGGAAAPAAPSNVDALLEKYQ